MYRFFMSSVLMLFSMTAFAQQFTPTKEPVGPDGTKAICDIPGNLHIRNVGGSDSAGLCVFSSANLSFRWHNMPELDDFQKWMRQRPGGGWPEKLDKMIAQFCKEKGVPVPLYIQHTGGDDSFLDLALKTDRLVCVTYAGNDDFYRGTIAHMVNLAHIDDKWAALIDNNRPNVWLWMSRSDFLKRWRANSGGWAVAFLAPPPPPYPEPKAFNALPADDKACICGDDCKCVKGSCPNKCPVSFGQCPGGRCPTPLKNASPFGPDYGLKTTPLQVGQPPSDDHYWGQFTDGSWGWRLKDKVENKNEKPVIDKTKIEEVNYGVDFSRIHVGKRYTLPNGVEITEDRTKSLLTGDSGLVDDTNRWHLTAVGDETFLKTVKGHLSGLPVDTKSKLHVQFYSPTDWPVSKYSLPIGISLRKPSPGRVSEQVDVLATGDYSLDKLLALLGWLNGKPPAPPQPIPVPVPLPNTPDIKPLPTPSPEPVPAPQPVPNTPNWTLLGLLALAVYLLTRKK